MQERVAIVTSGYLPVPATQGGGVEVLDEYLINENERGKLVDFTVFSSCDGRAQEVASKYTNTTVKFIYTPKIIKVMDSMVYWIAKKVLRVSKPISYRYIFQRISYINKVARDINKHDYDKIVFENHATLLSSLRYKQNFEKYKGKYFFHLHNEVTKDYGNKKYIQESTKVLGVSAYINSTLSAKYPDMKNEQFKVLRNAVDRSRFSMELSVKDKIKIRKDLGLEKRDFVFLFSGRLTKEKGIVEALKAFKMANIPNSKFLVVGSTFFATDVKSQFETKLGQLIDQMNNKVIFTGFIPNESMGKVYAASDVSVLPSIWDDPAPLTVIESIVSGKPIITTDSGGIQEYVTPENSITVHRDKHIVENISKAMLYMTNHQDMLEKMKQESKIISSDLTTERFYNDFCRIIKDESNDKFI
ncbi:MAG: glycosyltransferase family 4 protein [Lactococcus lactis]|uniref:glycosyltransferase family 4 protein n=1 Tax=Lactococcus TaxID=1357 RepID=UPI00223B8D96|nr:glycosyltransferase family 4 protein [Lactococcus cremoris]MCT0486975.1 glycosyltransferase [Lactococcus cremoris]